MDKIEDRLENLDWKIRKDAYKEINEKFVLAYE